jgi:hypothetical protein
MNVRSLSILAGKQTARKPPNPVIRTEAPPAVRVFGENREAAYRPREPLVPKETS